MFATAAAYCISEETSTSFLVLTLHVCIVSSFVHSFSHSFVQPSFIHLFSHLFIRSFICSAIHSFTRSIICSAIGSFTHLFWQIYFETSFEYQKTLQGYNQFDETGYRADLPTPCGYINVCDF